MEKYEVPLFLWHINMPDYFRCQFDHSSLHADIYKMTIDRIVYEAENLSLAEKVNYLSTLQNDFIKCYSTYSDDGGRYSGQIKIIDRIVDFIGKQHDKASSELSKKLSNSKTKVKVVERVLRDIWKGDDNSYNAVIRFLSSDNLQINGSFITEREGKKYWNKIPTKGWVKYLTSFIYVCIDNKFILKVHSASEYKDILCRTFNIDTFNEKPFQLIHGHKPDDKYLTPFSNVIKKIREGKYQ
jgi:hypothetical protein